MSLAESVAVMAGSAGLLTTESEPVFDEPWQAEAFGLAVQLHADGRFTWSQWTAALSAAIAEAGPTDNCDRYYACWLHALEHLAVTQRLVTTVELDQRRTEWIEAYETTPHGQAVALRNGTAMATPET